MIIFNTKKKAEHYVRWISRKNDLHQKIHRQRSGHDWESIETYIQGNLVITRRSGDGCGCGCGDYIFDYTIVKGRIKSHDTKTIRNQKLKNLGV